MAKKTTPRIESFGPKSQEIIDISMKYEIFTHWFYTHIRPVVPDSAEGVIVRDVDGNEYIDFFSSFATMSLGHCHPEIVETAIQQAKKLTHVPDGPNRPRALLAKKLSEIVPRGLTKSTFSLGGGSAVELGLRLAKTYTGKYGIIAFLGAYHGRTTLGVQSLTTTNYSRQGCGPFMPGVIHVPYAYCYRCSFGKEYPQCDLWCARYIESLFKGQLTAATDIATLIVEPIQGVAGNVVPPDTFLPELGKICKEHGILFFVDEIQTGFGRFGDAMTASEALGIQPDIICFAKALGSGFPISAVITRDDIAEKWEPVMSSETFMGNPLLCSIALKSIELLERMNAPKKAKSLGAYMLKAFTDSLKNLQLVGDIRGRGAFAAIELVKDKKTKEPIDEETWQYTADLTLRKGLMLNFGAGNYGNVINTVPPLIATEEHIDRAVDILTETLRETQKKFLF